MSKNKTKEMENTYSVSNALSQTIEEAFDKIITQTQNLSTMDQWTFIPQPGKQTAPEELNIYINDCVKVIKWTNDYTEGMQAADQTDICFRIYNAILKALIHDNGRHLSKTYFKNDSWLTTLSQSGFNLYWKTTCSRALPELQKILNRPWKESHKKEKDMQPKHWFFEHYIESLHQWELLFYWFWKFLDHKTSELYNALANMNAIPIDETPAFGYNPFDEFCMKKGQSKMIMSYSGDHFASLQERYERGSEIDKRIIDFIVNKKADRHLPVRILHYENDIMLNIDMMVRIARIGTSSENLFAMSRNYNSNVHIGNLISALWVIKCEEEGLLDGSSLILNGVRAQVCRFGNDNYISDIRKALFDENDSAGTDTTSVAVASKDKVHQRQKKTKQSLELPDHFSDDTLSKNGWEKILDGLMRFGWLPNQESNKNWVYRLTGILPAEEGWQPSAQPIVFNHLNQCRYFVKTILFQEHSVNSDKWDMVKKIFTCQKGDIHNVEYAAKPPQGASEVDKLVTRVREEEESEKKTSSKH